MADQLDRPLAAFEIEEPPTDVEAGREVFAHRDSYSVSAWVSRSIFPLDVFATCPILWFLPVQWHKLQGWTHTLLVLGCLACTGLVIDGVWSLYARFTREYSAHLGIHYLDYVHHSINLIFIFPCLFYFMKTVGQFDEDLHTKKLAVEVERQKLIAAFMETLGDMTDILTQATETNTGFSERTFESKRRDFLKFLERTQGRFADTVVDSGTEQKFFIQMRQFCSLWFKAFAECSLNAAGDPKIVVSEQELDNCTSLDEICTLCKERLKASEVKFISLQQANDANEIEAKRSKLRGISKVGELMVGPESNYKAAKGRKSVHYSIIPTVATKELHFWEGISWLTFGLQGFQIQRDLSDDGFPSTISFGIGCVILLSREHVALLYGFMAGIVMILIDVFLPGSQVSAAEYVLIILNEFCIGATLVKFEDIDIIQQLVKEAREVDKERQAVDARKEAMTKFWGTAQRQTDMWLHRTTPRLDLFGEVHSNLEDLSNEEALKVLPVANQKFQELHDKLGPLEAWCVDGELSEKAKKGFEQAVTALCQERDLAGILDKFDPFIEELDVILEHPAFLDAAASDTKSMAPGMLANFQREKEAENAEASGGMLANFQRAKEAEKADKLAGVGSSW